MDSLEQLRIWLSTCPYLSGEIRFDTVGVTPGSMGLYSCGREETGRQEDVLGNVTTHCMHTFMLYMVCSPEPQTGKTARQMIQVQDWVNQQSMEGNAPIFGDVPRQEKIWAERGKLHSVAKSGTWKYEMRLIVQFQKKFEGS